MADESDQTVVESKDVTDLSGEEIDEEVDEMLDTSDMAESTEEEDEQEVRPEIEKQMHDAEQAEEEKSTEVAVSAEDEYESFDFDEQEWTLDEKREPEVRTIRGMKFRFEEPESDDDVLNQLEAASDASRDGQMYSLVQLVVDAPEVTQDRWEDMALSAKLALAGQAADYLDLDEGFLEE